MFLAQLRLTQFRNFRSQELEFERPITVLQGPNGAGKTNFLDSVCYLATCKSHKSQTDPHSIHSDAPAGSLAYFEIRAAVRDSRGDTQDLRVFFGPGQADGRPRKLLEANGARQRAVDMMGRLRVILFIPQDTQLLSGGPGLRRRALDIALCQIDRAYFAQLLQYQQVLRERNALLKQLRLRGNLSAVQVEQETGYWDDALVRTGAAVMSARASWLELLAHGARPYHARMTENREELSLDYRPSVRLAGELSVNPASASVSDWEAAFQTRLQESLADDLGRASTGAGPHRDNVDFRSNSLSLSEYGSRGQQRTAIVAYRLAEVGGVAERSGAAPVLLLDDVMSELDAARQATVVDAVRRVDQVIMTTTDWEQFPGDFLDEASLWNLREGLLQPA